MTQKELLIAYAKQNEQIKNAKAEQVAEKPKTKAKEKVKAARKKVTKAVK